MANATIEPPVGLVSEGQGNGLVDESIAPPAPKVPLSSAETGEQAKKNLELAADLELSIEVAEENYTDIVLWDVPADPDSISDEALNYNFIPSIEFVEQTQPQFRAGTKQSIRDLKKRLALPANATRIEKFDRMLHILADPALWIFYKFAKGMLLNSPEPAWAGIKQIIPEDMQNVVADMTLDEAINWALDYNPGAVADFMGETGQFVGGISTVGKLLPTAGPGFASKAIAGAVTFGGAKGAEEFAKLTADLIDPDTSYGYEGAKGVAIDTGIGAGFAILGSAAKPIKSAVAKTAFGRALEEGAHKTLIALTKKFPLVMDSIRKDPQAHFTKQVLRFVKKQTGMNTRNMTITQKAAVKHVAREGERRFLLAQRTYLKNVPPDVVQAVKRRGLALPGTEPAVKPPVSPVEPTKPIVPVKAPAKPAKAVGAKPEAFETSDLATSPNIPISQVEAKKQATGKFKLFFRGTTNEVFQDELFNSASEARQFFKVQKIKAQKAFAKPPTEAKVEITKAQVDAQIEERAIIDKFLIEHDASKGTVPAEGPFLSTRDEEFAKRVNAGIESGRDSVLYPGELEHAEDAIRIGEKLGYKPDDIAAYLQQNYITRPFARPEPPTEAKPFVGPKPLITIKKPGVKIQRPPDKKPPTVAMKPGFVDFGPLVDAGPQVKKVSAKASKLVRRFGGLDSDVRKVFIEYEEQLRELPKVVAKDSIEKFGHLSFEEETLIQQHREQPKKFPDLPDDLTPTLKVLETGIAEYGRRLEELGYSADWPNQYLNRLEKMLGKELARDEVDVLKVTNLEAAIEEAQDLQYLHHFYEQDPVGKRIIGKFRRAISKRPKGVLGRTIPTLEKAKELGLTPAPLAVSYAHMAHEVARAELANDLITAINLNPELSLPEDLAPQEWVRLDERIFPAGVQHSAFVNEDGKPIHVKKFRKYPIPIAEALEEIAWTRNFSALEKAYDKLNFGLKIIGFYNPVVMVKNDAVQLWRAAGIKGAIPLLLPQMEGGINTLKPSKAIQIWAEKGPEYEKLRKGGLFNNIVSYTPAVTEITQSMLNHIRETSGEKSARLAKEWLNPVNLPRNLRKMNDASTWNMDEIMRIATYEAVKNQPMLEGMTDFEKIEWVNDALVNYGSIPKETKRWINKAMFTPSYRIGNFSFFWRNIAPHPWRMKGPLLRTVGYKMFIRWGLPAIVSAAIAYKINEDRDVRTEKGYKLIIHNPDTGSDTVYSLSDPLLEGIKITQRPFTDTIGLNLAPVPSLIIRLLGGPKRRHTDDPFGEFFKLGTPVWRDIVNWKDPDKTVPQKLLTQFAIAYVYTRRGREADKENIVEAMAKTLAIWTDWKEQSAKVKQVISGRSYYLGPGGKFGRLIREFNMEQDIDRDETDARIDAKLGAGKYKEALEIMAETERYETTEGVSGRILKHRDPIAYYWQVMSKSDKEEFIQWVHDNKLYTAKEMAELGEALERAKRP